MSEWWQRGYPGGPMVAVKGFPRELQPPARRGAPVASPDGSDVEAYKRTISRAGRWVWAKFDQQFSFDFAMGKDGGNVSASGCAGVQRQQGMPASGAVDKAFFNTLRSIRIPAGLPHAGEPAMDATAVRLINEAWDRFQGQELPEPPSGSSAQARLKQAIGELGVKESPANSNQCLYTDWYNMVGPWCAMFVSWSDQLSGKPTESFLRGKTYAYCPYIVDDARYGRNGLTLTSAPQPGDLCLFDWSYDGEYDHVGLVEVPPDSWGNFVSIEGNTSPEGSSGSQSNGGEVCRRNRNVTWQATLFVRVAEP